MSSREPIRIFVGCADSHSLLVAVLKHSIQRRTKRQVELTAMSDLALSNPLPKSEKNWPATPFSFQRFAPPELVNFKGRAIYMDSDQIVFKDIEALFDRPMWGKKVLIRPKGGPDKAKNKSRSSVMLLNCSKLDWQIDKLIASMDADEFDNYRLISLKFMSGKGRFPRHWNSLDHYETGKTALLHFSRRDTQPWIGTNHPWAHLWFDELFSAIDAGDISLEEVHTASDNGYVRPSLIWQVEQREKSPAKIPAHLHKLDKEFLSFCKANNYNNIEGNFHTNSYSAS